MPALPPKVLGAVADTEITGIVTIVGMVPVIETVVVPGIAELVARIGREGEGDGGQGHDAIT